MKTKTQISKALRYVAALCLTLGLAFLFQVSVNAAPEKVAGLKQTDSGDDSISLEWTALLDNDVNYEVWVSTDQKKWVLKEDSTYDNKETISNLNAGTTYYVKVRAYIDSWSKPKEYSNSYSNVLECVTAPNSAPSTFEKTGSTTTSISLKWSSVPGANCYKIVYQKNGSRAEKSVLVTGTKATLKKLSKNSTYSIEVNPARRTSTKSYTAVADYKDKDLYRVGVTPGKVSGVYVPYNWYNINEMKIGYKTIDAANGYQAELWSAYGKEKRLTKNTGDSYGTYLKNGQIHKHKFFKVRVRAYVENSKGTKSYGAWSGWKYVSQQPDVLKMKSSKAGITITYDTIDGANRYDIYASTKQKSGYKKIGSTNKTKYLIKSGKNLKLKKGKKYYVYVVPYKKVGKKCYSSDLTDYDSCWYTTYRY